jgi:rhamnosyltransferase
MAEQATIRTEQSVCAVIVTYHPTASMTENMPKVLAQVQGLVVIDNGSNAEELNRLRITSQTFGFQLIENGDNLGIAEALNRGVLWAKGKDFPWVILFDQDSKITDGFMDQMFEAWRSHPVPERVASIHPRYVDPVTNIEPPVFRASDGGPITSMTSGALMPTWIFDKIGFFPAEYFIDQVDTEYGYRIRAAGYLSADSRQAVLFHSPGHPKRINFLGFSFEPTHHSATRRYYFTRNRVAVYRKYFRVFPRWILHTMYISLRETIKCFVAEKDRPRKFRNLLLGVWDGLTGRMGKREGL